MDPRDAELLAKLLPTFRLEAGEHLRRIEALLGSLEKEASPAALQEAFREVHSLKGAARAVGARELEALCQEMETLFAEVTKGGVELGRRLLDLLYLAADLASDMAREAGKEGTAELKTLAAETTRRLRGAARGQPVEPPSPPRHRQESVPDPPLRPADTLRIGTRKIEYVLRQAEELLGSKLAAREQKESLEALLGEFGRLRRGLALAASDLRALQRTPEGISPDAGAGERARKLHRLVSHLADGEERARLAEESVRRLADAGDEHFRSVANKVDALLEAVRETLMLPVGSLLEAFPRMARELARDSGKEVELDLSGGEIPVDRRILEEIRDPLHHLLRNAVDHGLEPPEERRKNGKEARGVVRLEVSSPSPRRVLFTLRDDGRGMDLPGLKKAAVREGIVSEGDAEALDEWEIATLAFTAGLSTRESVTTVSGRGLGLSIVREKVEALGGEVHVSSVKGGGDDLSPRNPRRPRRLSRNSRPPRRGGVHLPRLCRRASAADRHRGSEDGREPRHC